jgi:hypothetical protein
MHFRVLHRSEKRIRSSPPRIRLNVIMLIECAGVGFCTSANDQHTFPTSGIGPRPRSRRRTPPQAHVRYSMAIKDPSQRRADLLRTVIEPGEEKCRPVRVLTRHERTRRARLSRRALVIPRRGDIASAAWHRHRSRSLRPTNGRKPQVEHTLQWCERSQTRTIRTKPGSAD